MLSQPNKSMTKTSPGPTAVSVGVTSAGATMENAGSSDLKMGTSVSVSTNSSSTGSTNTNASTGGQGQGVVPLPVCGSSSPGARSDPGSQNSEHLPKLLNILPAVTLCTYTPCYCEENVWKLCDKVRSDFPTALDYCHVAFISNKKRMVPMWRQKAGKNEEKLALWDYHVILLYNPDDRCVVYDMDSELPFPTHFHRYVSETFRTENILQPEYHRFFRIIPASRFLSVFSSDRSHMLKPDRTWIKPPPNYPPICSGGVNNLEQFIDMSDPKNEFGEVFTLMEIVRKFYKPRQLS